MATKTDPESITVDNSQTVHDNQYANLNLNQNLKCLNVSSIQSNSKSYNNKNCGSSVSDNIEGRKNPLHLNKSSKISDFSNPIKTENEEFKREWETNSYSNTINSSTISHHNAAHENSAQTDSFNGSKNKDLQKGKSDSIKNEIFTDGTPVIQNSFEFPWQINEGARVPEVSNFKASQRLLNPNKASKNVMASTTSKKVKKPFKPVMGKLPLADKVILPCKDGKSYLINVKKLIQVTKSGKLQPLNETETKLLEQASGQRKRAQQKFIADAAKEFANLQKQKEEIDRKIAEIKARQNKK